MTQIKLKGFPAVVVILGIVGFSGFRMMSARSSLDEAGNAIIPWIQGEYTSRHLRDIGDVSELTPEKVDSILWQRNITFPSIKAHGTPDDMVVRVEVLFDGHEPPDGNSVQYWRMEYSTILGWRVRREVSVFSYYLAIL